MPIRNAKSRNPEGVELVFDRSVPPAIREEVTEKRDLCCQICGISAGDTDETTGRTARFAVSFALNNGLGIPGKFQNTRTLCSTCNQGAKNITGEKPTSIWLLSQIRRAGLDEQKAAFDWLARKFGKRGQ